MFVCARKRARACGCDDPVSLPAVKIHSPPPLPAMVACCRLRRGRSGCVLASLYPIGPTFPAVPQDFSPRINMTESDFLSLVHSVDKDANVLDEEHFLVLMRAQLARYTQVVISCTLCMCIGRLVPSVV